MKLRKPVVITLIAAAPVLAYAGVCGWMYAKQRDILYLPQTTRTGPEHTDFGIVRNGVMLNGWLVNIGQPDAVMYFGGNAERIEMRKADFAKWFPNAAPISCRIAVTARAKARRRKPTSSKTPLPSSTRCRRASPMHASS